MTTVETILNTELLCASQTPALQCLDCTAPHSCCTLWTQIRLP